MKSVVCTCTENTACITQCVVSDFSVLENLKERKVVHANCPRPSLTLELYRSVSRSRAMICTRRLDTRKRCQEVRVISRQRVVRTNFNGEFLIGQFVPSRSDEQFHDGVVSPLIRLKGCTMVLCAQALSSLGNFFRIFQSGRAHCVKFFS